MLCDGGFMSSHFPADCRTHSKHFPVTGDRAWSLSAGCTGTFAFANAYRHVPVHGEVPFDQPDLYPQCTQVAICGQPWDA